MQLGFVKASPCSNTTVFIVDKAEKAKYGEIAAQVMDYDHLCAEQLGFITEPFDNSAVIRLEMSGGEFCGNALLSAAALVRYKSLTDKNKFYLECSGVAETLGCEVNEIGRGKYFAKAEMPADYKLQELTLTADGREYCGHLVIWSGISHFVFPGEIPEGCYEKIMEILIKKNKNSAYGIIPYIKRNSAAYFIRPYVYVPETGSRVFEQACGSGSLSLGVALSEGKTRVIEVSQPGGVIKVFCGPDYYIAAEVFFSCEGTVFVED